MSKLFQLFKSQQSGFTLIELIVYTVVLSIIAVGFVTFAIDLASTSQKARVATEVQQSARFTMERILQEIRSADALDAGGSVFGSNPGTLSLTVDTPSENPTVIDVSGGILQITRGANPSESILPDNLEVIDLTFTDFSVTGRTSNIRVSLTIGHPNPTSTEVFDAQTSVVGSAVIRSSESPI